MFALMVGATAPDHWNYRYYSPLDGELPESPTACQAWLITGSKFGAYEGLSLDPCSQGFHREGLCRWRSHGRHLLRPPDSGGKPRWQGGQVRQGLGALVAMVITGRATGPDWLANTGLAGKPDFSILAFHQDQVVGVPPDAKVIASSDFCEVAALVYGDQVLSFQGHPEFGPDFVGELIESRRDTLLGDHVADLAMTSLETSVDKDAIGAGIVAFLKAREEDWKKQKAEQADTSKQEIEA